MNNKYFYENLKIVDDFNSICNDELFHAMPEDWYVVVSDVIGSTVAIDNGKYKDVNMVGALSIISILNIDKKLDIPFIFGGDGAFLLIPKDILNQVSQALLSIKKLAKDNYNLDLRVGIIPIKDIYKNQKNILIAKFKVSDTYAQATLKGGGLEYSDELLKSSVKYHIKDKVDADFILDFDGLECRWDEVKSSKDETLSILIKCSDDNYYEKVLNNIDNILGKNKDRNPICQENLSLSLDKNTLISESKSYTNNKLLQSIYVLKFQILNLVGKLLISFGVSDWNNYKNRVQTSTDTEKFDDMLRMVVSSSFAQTQKLEEYLENEHAQNKLCYGIHKAESALMTCLVFQRHGKHIHFVDSANGGYAMAAKPLKMQIKK